MLLQSRSEVLLARHRPDAAGQWRFCAV